MINLNIQQNNELLKNIDENLLEFLYNLSKGLDSNVSQYMKGRLEVIHGYADAIDFLTSKFQDLYINSAQGTYIRFKDSVVQEKLANKWGDGFGITTQEAALQTSGSQIKSLFSFNTNITSFDELKYFIGIKELPSETFRGCSNLESIDLQNVERITGNNCFTNCNKLTSIGDYSNLVRVDSGAFTYTDLTGEYDFSNINEFKDDTKEALGFQNTLNLISVKMPAMQETLCGFYGSGVYHITNCLGIKYIGHEKVRNCTNLQELDCPNLETMNGSAHFYGDTSLKTVNFPKLNYIEGSNSFYYCTSLEKITLGPITKFNYGMFNNCQNLTTINCDFSKILSIDNVSFYNCKKLTSISCINAITLGQECFKGCTSLTSVDFPKVTEIIGNAVFSGCTSLTQINLPLLQTINGSSTFYNCTSLTQIINLPLLQTINGNSTFSGCKFLEAHFPLLVDIGNYCFENCINLTTIELSNNISNIPIHAFRACRNLSNITPSTLHLSSIGQDCFFNCSLLQCNIDLSLLTSIPGNAFRSCKNITFSGLNEFQPQTIDTYAFYECNLGELDLSKVRFIGLGAFDKTTNFSIKNNDLTSIIELSGWAFNENVTINGILDLGENLLTVGNEAFSRLGCDIIIRSPQVPNVSTGQNNLYVSEGHYLYVLDNLINDYIASGACRSEQVKGISELPST